MCARLLHFNSFQLKKAQAEKKEIITLTFFERLETHFTVNDTDSGLYNKSFCFQSWDTVFPFLFSLLYSLSDFVCVQLIRSYAWKWLHFSTLFTMKGIRMAWKRSLDPERKLRKVPWLTTNQDWETLFSKDLLDYTNFKVKTNYESISWVLVCKVINWKIMLRFFNGKNGSKSPTVD